MRVVPAWVVGAPAQVHLRGSNCMCTAHCGKPKKMHLRRSILEFKNLNHSQDKAKKLWGSIVSCSYASFGRVALSVRCVVVSSSDILLCISAAGAPNSGTVSIVCKKNSWFLFLPRVLMMHASFNASALGISFQHAVTGASARRCTCIGAPNFASKHL